MEPFEASGATFGTERFPLWGEVATLMVTDLDRLRVARRAVDQVFADIDAACGVHRGESDLARVHAGAGRPVRVGTTFHALLWTALHAAEVTGGLADPIASGPHGAWRSIVIDEPQGTVTLPPGTTMDLWPMATAFAADRAAELAAGQAQCGVFVSIAKNVGVAGPVPATGWPARVTNGHYDVVVSHDVVLRATGGMATRNLAVPQRRAIDGRDVPHVVDPRPGHHVRGPWRTVSVTAGSCVDAGTAGAAALASGHDAVDWLRSVGLPARLVHADDWVQTVGNWPADPASPV
ncbi:FAD:protein FMN transferase [Actinomadura sp. 6N118]|uniref:FAD:protein FMN transferase n=1 Tax=Actinomadura sp. 6N118 TaxID=3375151 RepID=UPI0037A9D8D5